MFTTALALLFLVKQMNYLGIVFDDKLTCKSHIHCAKLSNGSWALLKLQDYVDINNMLKTVYYSLMHSYIQYCSTTWGVASTKALEPAEKNAQSFH